MIKGLKLDKMWLQLKHRNALWVALIVIFWMIGLAFSNYATSQNLQHSELDRNLRSLEDEQRLADAAVSELQGLDRIELASQRLNLVKVDSQNVIYLNSQNGKVALK